ncbi:FtsX-like permease family protein [Alloiococcus sp. CFN-8]|uniref:ABC transporter permease n=1 Tax=Alloiococcus sp. CFN-8 TaxID=3416081 RepID=UPI003CEB2CFF
MIILKIALEGMRGRKKQTALLLLVILLSFTFIVSATMFYGGIAETEENARLAMYGQWQAAYLSADKGTTEYLKENKSIDKISVNRIVDRNTDVGVLGTIDESFLKMGKLSMVTGKLPEKPNEIALDLSTFTELGLSEADIGNAIRISSEVIYTLVPHFEITEYLNNRKTLFGEKTINYDLPYTYTRNGTEVNNEFETKLNTPISNSDDHVISIRENFFYYGPSNPSEETIKRDGLQTNKTLILNYYYVLTGVIDSYSERWDTAEYPVVNAFLTEEGADNHYNKLRNSSALSSPAELLKIFPEEYNVFMYSEALGENLYDELFPGVMKFLAEENKDDGNLTEFLGGEGDTNEGTWKFRKNKLAYPSEANEQKERLIYTVMAAIFIISAISIFQLYLSQTRRRARTFALLKAIGATNHQVVKVFLAENIVLLMTAMPIGILLGIALSLGAEKISILLDASLEVAFIPSITIQGIIITMLSLFIGMILPIFYALSVPITGTVEKPPSHRKRDEKDTVENIEENSFSTKNALRKLNKSYSLHNRGKSILALSMSLITCVLLLSSVLLSYISREKYIDEVLQKGKPDYVLELLQGIPWVENTLKDVPGIKDISTFWKGNDLHVYYEGIEEDEIVSTFKESLPPISLGEYFGGYKDSDYGLKEVDSAIITNFYSPLSYLYDEGYFVVKGTNNRATAADIENQNTDWYSIPIYEYSDTANKIFSSITDGELNEQKFWSGEEVILLMPMYSELQKNPEGDIATALETSSFQSAMSKVLEAAGKYKLSLNEEEIQGMKKNNGIRIGDSLWISANEEPEENYRGLYKPREVKVGGIIRYFPEKGLWPFSETNQNYSVIGSPTLLEDLYVGFGMNLENLDKTSISLLNQTIAKVKLGRTVFYLYGEDKGDFSKTEDSLQEIANKLGGYVTNFREDNKLLLSEATNNTAILALLCVVSAALATIILYNSLSSRADQDKKRTGILQAIGVTKKQLKKTQLSKGIRNALISLIASHIILISMVYILFSARAEASGLDIMVYINKFINYYSFYVHIAVVIIYFIITIFIYTLPTRRVIKNSPVENING